MSDLRIGIGYDVHAFVEGRPLVLGGVVVPAERGLLGHSDADVLVHAVMDAIIGAMREGDIGRLFPDDDDAYKDISSIALLERVFALAASRGFRIVDVDSTLVLQAPKVAPYRDQMRENMARALGLPVNAVGVKATTTEGLGFAGREEGAAAYALSLIHI